MPRTKRPLAELDPNDQRPTRPSSDDPKPKKPRMNAKSIFEQSSFEGQYECACMDRPPWSKELENIISGDSDQVLKRSASESPEWKWIMLRESFDLLYAAHRDTDNRNPDMFRMYVYKGFLGYGIIEVLENMLKAFNKELKPSKGRRQSFHQMWAIVTSLANYINRDVSYSWMMVDDSDRRERLNAMIGAVILTALNELDRIGQLKADSKFLDLGHVMALFLLWSTKLDSSDIEYEIDSEAEAEFGELVIDWQAILVTYASKAGIDIRNQGVDVSVNKVRFYGLPGKVRVERWEWTALLGVYRGAYLWRPTILALPTDNIGGDRYDITKWESEERAKYSFDKKDSVEKGPDSGSDADQQSLGHDSIVAKPSLAFPTS